MADWKTYAKAARNTARRQARNAPRRNDPPRSRSLSMGDYARAGRKALDEGTRESRDSFRRSGERARKDAAAYAAVAQRRVEKAQLGRRITAAFRDAVLVGLSLFIIWFVVTRTGVQIPFSAVLAVVGIIVVLRFGWALVAQFRPRSESDLGTEEHDADPETTAEAASSSDPRVGAAREQRSTPEPRQDREPRPHREPVRQDEREFDPRPSRIDRPVSVRELRERRRR